MRIGVVLLPERDWPEDQRRWARAELYGFDHAWTLDHLAWRSLADSPWFATIPVLAAAALSTSTLRIGTFVASPNFRHPIPLAKELMTLDVMSQGRLTVAVGAGAAGPDSSMLGQQSLTAGQRSERFGEFVELLDLLLRQPKTSWQGRWYTAVEARNIPGPKQRPRPPFIVAANGPKGMRLAVAKAQGWATLGTANRGATTEAWWTGVARAARRFDQVAAQMGGPPHGFCRFLDMEARASTTQSVEQFRDDIGRASALGFTDVVTAWPRTTEPFAWPERLVEEIASQLPSIRND